MKLKEKSLTFAKKLAGKWLYIALALNLVLVLCMVLLYKKDTKNPVHYVFGEQDIAQYVREKTDTSDNGCFGGTIDESYESGLYNAIPSFFLKKGHYIYKASWEGDSTESFLWPHVFLDHRYNTIQQAVAYMNAGVSDWQQDFWINVDYDVSLRLYYSGQGSLTIKYFEIWETKDQAVKDLFLRIMGLIALDLIAAVYIYNRKKTIPDNVRIAFFGIVAITLLTSIPAMFPKMIDGNDLGFHLCRIGGIKEAWIAGQFPVRINPVFYNGYGYANPVFYGDFLLYIPAFLQLVGFRLTEAYNFYVVFMNFLTALIAYYSFSKLLKKDWVALATTFLYCMAPYRLVDIYLRTAVGEYNAMAFLPLVVYGLYLVYTENPEEKRYKYSFIPLTVGITGVLQNHILSTEMIAIFIFMTCIFLIPMTLRKKRFWMLAKTVIVSLLLNMCFLVPFLDYSSTGRFKFTVEKKVTYLQEYGVLWGQFFDVLPKWSWVTNVADNSIRSEMPVNLGMSLCLCVLVSAGLVILSKKEDSQVKRCRVVFIMGLCLIACWMSSAYFPWDVLIERFRSVAYLICSIQFIWRYLSIATVLAALLGGFAFVMLEERAGKGVAVGVSCVLCMLSLISGAFFMEDVLDNGKILDMNDCYSVDTMGAVSGSEYAFIGSSWNTELAVHGPEVLGNIGIKNYEKQGTVAHFTVTESGDEGRVLLPMIAFKGYRVKSKDGMINQDCLSEGDSARVQIYIPEGFQGEVKVYYREPWYWRIAELISLCTLVGLIMFYVKGRKESIKIEKKGN